MLVMILKNVPASLRGELSRWLLEPEAGVFLGNPSARVRDELWKLATARAGKGLVMQIWTYPCPQGYQMRTYSGRPADRQWRECEGLWLVWRRRRAERQAVARAGEALAACEASDEASGEVPDGAEPGEPASEEGCSLTTEE